MSSLSWMLLLVLLLTLLGSLTLLLVTIKFYWGDRGKPPAIGEARRYAAQSRPRRRARCRRAQGLGRWTNQLARR